MDLNKVVIHDDVDMDNYSGNVAISVKHDHSLISDKLKSIQSI